MTGPTSANAWLDAVNARWPLVLLGAGMFGFGLLLMVLSRHLWFFQDEYSFIVHRGGWNANAFLADTNGHFLLVPVIIYKLLFVTVGLGHTWPYRLVLVGLHLTCVGLLYALAARRIGRVAALVPAGLLLGLGSAAPDLLFAIQISLVGSLAAVLGALLCLDREDDRGDRLAALLLFVSLASESAGVPLTLAVLVELALTRRTRRRLWVALVPLALYGLWYLGYGTSEMHSANIRKIPTYDEAIASYGFAGLFGTSVRLGGAMLVAALLWLGNHLLRGRRLSPRAIAVLLAALGFWTVVALARAQYTEPQAPRYIYPSALLILLAFVVIAPRPRLSLAAAVAFGGLLLVVGLANFTPLQQYARDRARTDALTRSKLGAAQIAGPVASARFRPDSEHLPWLYEGLYLRAVHELGSPASTPNQILAQSEGDREVADGVLLKAEGLPLVKQPNGQALSAAGPVSIRHFKGLLVDRAGVAGTRTGCTRLTAPSGTGSATFAVAPGHSLYLSSSGAGQVAIFAHRLARHVQSHPLYVLPPAGASVVLSFPRDASTLPWHIRVVPTETVAMCAV